MPVKLEVLLKKYDGIAHVIKVDTIKRIDETIVEVYLDVEGYDPKLMDVLLDIEYAIILKSSEFLRFHYITDSEHL